MASPTEIKKQLRLSVMAVLKRDGMAKEEVLTSSLKLESGFSEKVIAELLKDMQTVGQIEIKDGVITVPLGDNAGSET